MKFEIIFNKVTNTWNVWRISQNGNAEIVRHFKSEQAAKKWITKQ